MLRNPHRWHALIGSLVCLLAAALLAGCAITPHTDPAPGPTTQRSSPDTLDACYGAYISYTDPTRPEFPDASAVPVGQAAYPPDFQAIVLSVTQQRAVNDTLAWNGTYLIVQLQVTFTSDVNVGIGVLTGPWDSQLITNQAQRVCADFKATGALNKASFPAEDNDLFWGIRITQNKPVQFYAAFDVDPNVLPGAYLQYWSSTKWESADLDLGLT